MPSRPVRAAPEPEADRARLVREVNAECLLILRDLEAVAQGSVTKKQRRPIQKEMALLNVQFGETFAYALRHEGELKMTYRAMIAV